MKDIVDLKIDCRTPEEAYNLLAIIIKMDPSLASDREWTPIRMAQPDVLVRLSTVCGFQLIHRDSYDNPHGIPVPHIMPFITACKVEKEKQTAARRAVHRIVEDICSRRGLKQEWDSIEPGLQTLILEKWMEIITEEVSND